VNRAVWLLALIAGVTALFAAAIRLAQAVPPMWAPLTLLVLFLVIVVALALVAVIPSAPRWDRWGKNADWRRGRYLESLDREKRLRLRARGELAKADTEIALLLRERAEEGRTLAEVTRDLNAAHAEIRNLRQQFGRRKEDKDL
jgi:hypothetical protein